MLRNSLLHLIFNSFGDDIYCVTDLAHYPEAILHSMAGIEKYLLGLANVFGLL